MIHETTIKEKEFGGDFRRLVRQARFIALSLMSPENADSLECDEVMGAGYMLLDTLNDLDVIRENLCPDEFDHPKSETGEEGEA
jgi:hypothetical protein